MGGVAGHGAHVEPVLHVAQHLLVGIDHGDLVGLLARERLGGCAPDLTGAEDEDFHGAFQINSGSRLAYWTISHLVPWRSKLTWTRAWAPLPST